MLYSRSKACLTEGWMASTGAAGTVSDPVPEPGLHLQVRLLQVTGSRETVTSSLHWDQDPRLRSRQDVSLCLTLSYRQAPCHLQYFPTIIIGILLTCFTRDLASTDQNPPQWNLPQHPLWALLEVILEVDGARQTCLLQEPEILEPTTPSSVPSEEREKNETMNHRTETRITTWIRNLQIRILTGIGKDLHTEACKDLHPQTSSTSSPVKWPPTRPPRRETLPEVREDILMKTRTGTEDGATTMSSLSEDHLPPTLELELSPENFNEILWAGFPRVPTVPELNPSLARPLLKVGQVSFIFYNLVILMTWNFNLSSFLRKKMSQNAKIHMQMNNYDIMFINVTNNGSVTDLLADLRTTDQQEREKQNLERFDTLRRIAESARFAGNNMQTIQTIRDSFLPPGGFNINVPLTAPLGIPASDLARIAQQVPDPAANGEASSGTGKSSLLLKWDIFMVIIFFNYRNQTQMPILRENLRIWNQSTSTHTTAAPGYPCALPLLSSILHEEQHGTEAHRERAQAPDQSQADTGQVRE